MDLGPRYTSLEELGSGGTGRVFLVRDHYLKKRVALKLLHEDLAAKSGFDDIRREFALLAEIEHPGVSKVHDFGYRSGVPFFTSEYVPGATLDGTVSAAQALSLAWHVAEALAFLHRSEILHLDIKPSNILRPRRRPERPVLIDFGLVRRGYRESSVPPLKGSLPYMAAEYFGSGRIGPWTDVYALGVTLYRLLTGGFPRSVAATRNAATNEPVAGEAVPRSLSASCPGLSGDFENIILKCLAVDLRSRFPSAVELFGSLDKVVNNGQARPSGERRQVAGTVGRKTETEQVESFLGGLRGDVKAPRALIVTGPEGMGQSHLLRECKVRAQTGGWQFYLETGYPGRPTTPGSLLRCLEHHIQEPASRRRWRAFLARLKHPRVVPRNETMDAERRLRRAMEVHLAVNSVGESLVLGVDGLQYWDEVSIELLIELVRCLHDAAPGKAPPLACILGYREEGPSLALLKELTRCVLQSAGAAVVTLRPLTVGHTLELLRGLGGGRIAAGDGLEVFQRTGGRPAAIAALILEGSPARPAPPSSGSTPPSPGAVPSLRGDVRRVLLILGLLRRPVAVAELARLAQLPAARVRRITRQFEKREMVVESGTESGATTWIAAPAGLACAERCPPAERRQLSAAIADELVRRRPDGDDPKLAEAVRHYKVAGSARRVVEYGLPLARYLKSTFQNHAALSAFRDVLDALPRRHARARLAVAIDAAGLFVRLGDLDGGIRLLRDLLQPARRDSGPIVTKALLWLAILHSRRGEFQRADGLLEEGLCGRRGRRRLELDEYLFFLNEQAAVKAFLGKDGEARRLCEKGIALGKGSRNVDVREVTLSLFATRANLALRAFDHEAAVRDFEVALEIAEAISSLGNQAVILNNLGIVYSQRDRYAEAVQVFAEAERTCLRIDEGPSLASIYANRAALHAKTGDFAAMERSLSEGERLAPQFLGRRQRYILAHGKGLCLTYQGRYNEARRCLEEAIRLSTALGDRYMVQFDEVYRAEALLFEGMYAEAGQVLSRLTQPSRPPRIRKMALARRALFVAFTGRAGRLPSVISEYDAVVEEREIPFLNAWEKLFLGWALAVCGRLEKALERLEPAEHFFREHRLRPFQGLTRHARGEALLMSGRGREVWKLLESCPTAGNDLSAALVALLSARGLLAEAAAGGAAVATRCADLLAEAGAFLIGNPLPEWGLRLNALRRALRLEAPANSPEIEDERERISRELHPRARSRYLKSPWWSVWSGACRLPASHLSAPAAGKDRSEQEGTGSTQTIAVNSTGGEPFRSRLVARSAAMAGVVRVLDRLRSTTATVLIQGETGTGKELIARIIHEESERGRAPLRVLDCATMPDNLLESELFGTRGGVYSGGTKDRRGILELAAGGTVLLDEIGSISLAAQGKLLRVLAEGKVRSLGAEKETAIDVRFLLSTSKDLEAEVSEGRFRQDLYHRVHVLVVTVPPLRERVEDLEGLAREFLEESPGRHPVLEEAAVRRLQTLAWPGNVRELKNTLERLRLESPERITLESLHALADRREARSGFPAHLLAHEGLPELRRRLERDFMIYHFHRLRGDAAKLCEFLALSRRQLYRRCRRLGVKLREEKKKLGEGPGR